MGIGLSGTKRGEMRLFRGPCGRKADREKEDHNPKNQRKKERKKPLVDGWKCPTYKNLDEECWAGMILVKEEDQRARKR